MALTNSPKKDVTKRNHFSIDDSISETLTTAILFVIGYGKAKCIHKGCI